MVSWDCLRGGGRRARCTELSSCGSGCEWAGVEGEEAETGTAVGGWGWVEGGHWGICWSRSSTNKPVWEYSDCVGI